jgi:hypothetical protein
MILLQEIMAILRRCLILPMAVNISGMSGLKDEILYDGVHEGKSASLPGSDCTQLAFNRVGQQSANRFRCLSEFII